jgi:hypothetical protein
MNVRRKREYRRPLSGPRSLAVGDRVRPRRGDVTGMGFVAELDAAARINGYMDRVVIVAGLDPRPLAFLDSELDKEEGS